MNRFSVMFACAARRACALLLGALVAFGCTAPPVTAIPASLDPTPVEPPSVAPICAADETLCGLVCVPLGRDVHHCGFCGLACAADAACVRGHCEALDVAPTPLDPLRPATMTRCDPDRVACGSTCVDIGSDAEHCGACGNACDGTCILGICNAGGV